MPARCRDGSKARPGVQASGCSRAPRRYARGRGRSELTWPGTMAPFGSLSNVFTMHRHQVILSAAKSLLLLFALGTTTVAQSLDQAGTAAASHHPARGRVTDHVVIISIDGLRPDAIEKFKP